MNQNSVLHDLFIDEEEISEDILYNVLQPYLRFMKNSNDIMLTVEGNLLSVEKKVLITLLAQLALVKLQAAKSPGIRPKEFEKATDMNGSSIRGALRKLVDKNIIAQDEEGLYFVPSFGLQKALQTVSGK